MLIIYRIPPLFTVTNHPRMKTTDLAAVALSTSLWYTGTKKSLILAIKYNFNFLHFRAVKTILWRLCVYNPAVKNAAVSISADCLLISSVLQADGTDYFTPSPHSERNYKYSYLQYSNFCFPTIWGGRGCTRDTSDLVTKKSFIFVPFPGTFSSSDFQSVYINTHTSLSCTKTEIKSTTFW